MNDINVIWTLIQTLKGKFTVIWIPLKATKQKKYVPKLYFKIVVN